MTELAKAQLIELDQQFKDNKPGGEKVSVQFNPETLKVTFANALVQPTGGDNAAGNSGRQFVGAGTTKLALTLWFDVTAMTDNPVDDVRRLTQKVIYFMTPTPEGADEKKMIPPATRFLWGSFMFDGIVEGLEESLEFFAPDGKPLRASITLTIGQQKILKTKFKDTVPKSLGGKPLSPARQGDSLQAMAAKAPGNLDWQSIAIANGIEDPLRLAPGLLIDLRAGTGSTGFGGGVEISAPSISAPKIAVGASLGVN